MEVLPGLENIQEVEVINLTIEDREESLYNTSKFAWSKHILSGAKLTSQDLNRLNLAEAEVYFTDFSDSILDCCNFEQAYASRANFQGCSLKNVNFTKAYLIGASFRDADLEGSLFEQAKVSAVDFRGANLVAQNLSTWIIDLPAFFQGANLNYSECNGFSFKRHDLRKCRFLGADLVAADFREADLREADLRGANLENADLRGADLRGANLENANLSNALFTGANLENCLGADQIKASQYKGTYKFKTKKLKRTSTIPTLCEVNSLQIVPLCDGLIELFEIWKEEVRNTKQPEIPNLDQWREMASLILDFEWFGIKMKDPDGRYLLSGKVFACTDGHDLKAIVKWTQEIDEPNQVINLITSSPSRVLGEEKGGGASALIALICKSTQKLSNDLARAGQKRIYLKVMSSPTAKSWYQNLGFKPHTIDIPAHLVRNSCEYILEKNHFIALTQPSEDKISSEVLDIESNILNRAVNRI